jgi:hypothetical protein
MTLRITRQGVVHLTDLDALVRIEMARGVYDTTGVKNLEHQLHHPQLVKDATIHLSEMQAR